MMRFVLEIREVHTYILIDFITKGRNFRWEVSALEMKIPWRVLNWIPLDSGVSVLMMALKASCGRSEDVDEIVRYLVETSYRQLLTVSEEVYLRILPVSRFCDRDDGSLYFGTFCRLESQKGVSAKKLILHSIREVYNGACWSYESNVERKKKTRINDECV